MNTFINVIVPDPTGVVKKATGFLRPRDPHKAETTSGAGIGGIAIPTVGRP
jgi:hypothetical protein